jgi:pimeloyl-ACP methyl ester carboxylesterase
MQTPSARPGSALPEELRVLANGLEHHLLAWGDAQADQAVVLCHGFLDLAWGFAELGPRLAQAGYRVLAVDFRGHGETARVGAGGYYYFPDYVLDLHALLPQLLARPFHLLGHSMGGTVATLYAATHRERVASLSLLEGLGPRADAPERALERLRGWLEQTTRARAHEPTKLRDLDDALSRLRARHGSVDERFLRMLAEKSTTEHESGHGLRWRFDPLHRTSSPIAFDAARFMQSLASIDAPTLVLQGELGLRTQDHELRVAQLRNKQQALVPGAGHMLHWSHCDEVSAIVLAHLRAHAGPRRD